MSFLDLLGINKWFGSDEKSADALYSSPDQIKEIAVRIGLSGSGLNQERDRIEKHYRSKENIVHQKFNGEVLVLNTQAEQIETEIGEQKEIKNKHQETIARFESDELSALENIASQKKINDGAWGEVLRRRYEKGKDFLSDYSKGIAVSIDYDWAQIKKNLANQKEVEREIYQTELENYEQNKDELERRAEKCREDLAKIEGKIEGSNNRIELLKTFGITRYSARFLLIAGIISLAGAGSIISGLLQSRNQGPDLFSWILSRCSEFMNSMTPADFPQWSKLLIFMGVVLLFLLLFYLVIWASNWLVKKFDNDWNVGASEDDKDGKKNSNKQGKQGKKPEKKTERKTITNTIEESLTGSQGLKPYFDFLSVNIGPKDYARLVASFPYLFLVAFLIFLLSAGQPTGPLSMSTTYVGIVIALLSTSCCIIYVTKVIEPRWLRYATYLNTPPANAGGEVPAEGAANGVAGANPAAANSSAGNSIPRFFWVNKEIALLLILLVLSLLFSALLPVSDPKAAIDYTTYFNSGLFNNVIWGSMAIFVSLSSFGLAYGVVQSGLFYELDKLEFKKWVLIQVIKKITDKPVIGGSTYYPLELIDEKLERVHDIEDYKASFEINEILDDDYEFSTDWSGYILQNSFLGGIFKRVPFLHRKKAIVRELRPLDFSAAPDAAQKYVSSNATIAALEERIGNNKRRIIRLRSEIAEAEKRKAELEPKYLDLIKQKMELEAKLLADISKLIEEKERDLIIFTAAYTIGSVANELFKDEDIISKELIKPKESANGKNPSLPVELKLPCKALWFANGFLHNTVVDVLSLHGIVENVRFFNISGSAQPVPESELFIMDPVIPKV